MRSPPTSSDVLKKLLGDKYGAFDIDLIRHLHYQRLPLATQYSLFSVKDKLSDREIAQLAGDFMAALPPDPSVASAAVKPEADSHLAELVSQPALQISILTCRLDSRPLSSSPLRSRRGSRSSSRFASTSRASATSSSTCYYHLRFGREASKCQSPCDFTTGPLNLPIEH